MSVRRLLIHCPLSEGGIAEHAHYQAEALESAGVATTLLTAPGFLPDKSAKSYTVLPRLLQPYRKGSALGRRLWFAFATIVNELILAATIVGGGYRKVMLAATSETLALIWVWPHVLLRALGVSYAANIHDPQRKLRDGSALLHRWSVAAAFLPIRYGLIHEDFDTDQPDIPDRVECLPVPYGCYLADIHEDDGRALRSKLAPAGSGRRIFLSFGYIADRKNIDACIRAVAQVPEAVLIVAGRVASRHDKPGAYYRELAEELGCADRVQIDDGYIPDEAVSQYFGAADFVLLTYKREFVSQSGVLLLASNWEKPVLASSGPGPLSKAVRQFDLGPVVGAEDLAAMRDAMQALVRDGYPADGWRGFRDHASWDRNIGTLVEGFWGETAARASDRRDQ